LNDSLASWPWNEIASIPMLFILALDGSAQYNDLRQLLNDSANPNNTDL
jgi:hypothetical protein